MFRTGTVLSGFMLTLLASSTACGAPSEEVLVAPHFLGTPYGVLSLAALVVAYLFAVTEEKTHLRKSIPVMLAAGVIWILVAIAFRSIGDTSTAEEAFSHAFLEYGELFLFLLVAMTYVNTLQERNVFERMRYRLLAAGLSLRAIFWLTGVSAFFLSPVLDNLTTALIMCSVVVAVGGSNRGFVSKCCVSIVVAANAGGAFSPFGDITTLMVWQSGHVEFFEFFSLFLPSLVNWLVPAFLMSLSIKKGVGEYVANEPVQLKTGALPIVVLFMLTILISVSVHQWLHMPSVMGMMFGLGLLKFYGYFLSHHERRSFEETQLPSLKEVEMEYIREQFKPRHKPFDSFVSVKNVEWDTLLFFYGIVMSVAGLAALGYLAQLGAISYGQFGPTWSNIGVGIVSAFIDNIPVMYAILQMSPDMSHAEWMLATLTAGVGGSLISIGSAAGVALMGFARVTLATGERVHAYTFTSHLMWTPYILLGYIASVFVHLWSHDIPLPV